MSRFFKYIYKTCFYLLSFSVLFLGVCRLMIFLPFCVFFTVMNFRRCTVTAQKSCTFLLYFLDVIFVVFSRCNSSMYFHKALTSSLFLSLFFSLMLFVYTFALKHDISRVFHNLFLFILFEALYFFESS
jgi:hypothetical protein